MKIAKIIALLIFVILSACAPALELPKIDRVPYAANWDRGKMSVIPTYDPESTDTWQMDLRAFDLSKLDLSKSASDLLYASFDDETIWPSDEKMPKGFDWQSIMEEGKNPGLGIRDLHAKGITGKGVGVAIIDQTLLVEHQEYAKRIRLYEEMFDPPLSASMHGPAVASIAVGETTGVAPEADLYYIATSSCAQGTRESIDYSCLADSVLRILEINQQLPEERKIRVLAMAIGWMPDSIGYQEITVATEQAKEAGMLVVCSSIENVHGFKFHGLGREPFNDPDDSSSYQPGSWWASKYYDRESLFSNRLLIPMDSRTTASPHSNSEYVFYREGGWSWAIPYIAGLYTLSAQVNPEITPDQFWALAMSTGQTIEIERNGEIYTLGPIVDPGALISILEDSK